LTGTPLQLISTATELDAAPFAEHAWIGRGIGAPINIRRSAWTFGEQPIGVDDERTLDAWGNVSSAVLSGERA
jgi:hypothetical protein